MLITITSKFRIFTALPQDKLKKKQRQLGALALEYSNGWNTISKVLDDVMTPL